MKYLAPSCDKQFPPPQGGAHWAILRSSPAWTFLLLSCLLHTLLLGWLWRSIEFTIASNGATNALTLSFNILLTNTADSTSRTPVQHIAAFNTEPSTPAHSQMTKKHTALNHSSPATKTPLHKQTQTHKSLTTNHAHKAIIRSATYAQTHSTSLNQHALSRIVSQIPDKTLSTPLENLNSHNKAPNSQTNLPTPHTTKYNATSNTLTTQSDLHIKIANKVQEALKRLLRYPYLARQRGWDGKVMLDFQIKRDGQLINIHLSKSSGYTILDNSALSAMQEIRRIPLVPELFEVLPEVSATLHIPVIFRLTQG